MSAPGIAVWIRETSAHIALMATTSGAAERGVEQHVRSEMAELVYKLRWIPRDQFEAIREALACTTANGVDQRPDPAATNVSGCMNCNPVPKLAATLPNSENNGSGSPRKPQRAGDTGENRSEHGNCTSTTPSQLGNGSTTETTRSGQRNGGQQT